MAEQDFDIQIRTTADTAGAKAAAAALEEVKSVADQLAAAGAKYDPKKGGFVTAGDGAAPAAAAAVSAAAIATETEAAGTNLNRATINALNLARQLAAGEVSSASLVRLLSSLTPALAGAGIAGYTLYRSIYEVSDELEKVTGEVDKQVDGLGKAAEKWRELARNARDERDVLNIGKAVLPELEALSTKLEEVRAKELTGWQKVKDAIYSTLYTPPGQPSIEGPRAEALKLEKEQQESVTKTALDLSKANQESARKFQEAWEKVKLLPVQEGIAKVTEQLRELRQEQSEVDRSTAPGQLRYNQLGDQVETAKENLKELGNVQEKQNRAEEKRTKELEKQTAEIQKQNAARQAQFQEQIVAAGGSVTGALLAPLEANRQQAIQEQRQEAEAKDIQDRIKRGAYGQTELGGPAFRGGRPDFGPGAAGKKQPGDMTETNRILNMILNQWR